MRIASLTAVLLLTTACAPEPARQTTPLPASAAQIDAPPMVGMANPASVACGDLFGGELSIVHDPKGDYGMCTLPDGRVCEEWVLFQDHRCALNRDGPSIGEPVPPKAR